MIWLKDLVFTDMLTEVNMLDTGIKISNMDLAKKNGMMEANIKAFMIMLLKKVKESTAGLMATDMSESGIIICLMEKDYSFGMMTDFSLVIGKIT